MESLLARMVEATLSMRDSLLGRSGQELRDAAPPLFEASSVEDCHGFLTVPDGTCLFYRFWLPADAAPKQIVLCIHGAGAHGAHFRVVGDYVADKRVATYALDLRGHGLSGGRRGDLTVADAILQDLGEVIRFLRQTHPASSIYLWGESAGAPYIARYAAERGDTIDGMILSSPEIESAVKPSLVEYARHLPRALLDPDAKIVDMTGRLHLCNRGEHDVERELTDPLRNNRLDSRSILALYRLTREMPALARKITVPTLILQGGTDLVSNPRAVDRFYTVLSATDKRLVVFPEAYHGLLHDPGTPRVLAAAAEWLCARAARAGQSSGDR